jgi:hypothetical protein
MAQASFLKNYKQWIVWQPAQTPPFYEVWELAGDTFLDATVARPLKIHTQKTPECITGLLEGRLRYDDNTGIYTLTRDIRQPDTEIFFKENPKKNADGGIWEEVNGELKLQLKRLPDYANSVQQLLEISKLQTPIQDYLKIAKLAVRAKPKNDLLKPKPAKPKPLPTPIKKQPSAPSVQEPIKETIPDKNTFKRVTELADCNRILDGGLAYVWNFEAQRYDEWAFTAHNEVKINQKRAETYIWKFWDRLNMLLLRTKKQRDTEFTKAFFLYTDDAKQIIFERVDKEEMDFLLFRLEYPESNLWMEKLNPITYQAACRELAEKNKSLVHLVHLALDQVKQFLGFEPKP